MTTLNRDSKDIPPAVKRRKEVKPLLELAAHRDRHAKHYLNDDGSRTVEVSFYPVHYQDSQGKWRDISNKLVPADDQHFPLQNEANSFTVKFAANAKAPYLVSISSQESPSLSLGIENAGAVSPVNSGHKLTYPDIFPGVDLEYRPVAAGVKENIILKEPGTATHFTFSLKTAGLVPKQEAGGGIGFYAADKASEQPLYVMPKPFMVDAGGQKSAAVAFQLENTGRQDEFTLKLMADSNWLRDSARAYPVQIDPAITVYNEISSVNADTFILENHGVQNYNAGLMYAGYDSANQGRTRSLVLFTLPALPTGAIVTDAYFRVYKETVTTIDHDFIVARITSPWTASSVTWTSINQAIDSSDTLTPTAVTHVPAGPAGWVDFDVWSVVKGWYAQAFPNDGLMLMNNLEGNPQTAFHTSNNNAAPQLRITYIPDLLGFNAYWSYAATPWGSVNTVNGNFLSSSPDYSLPGKGVAIAVRRTYNSRTSLTGIFGNKWFSNLDIRLVPNSWGEVLIDATGTERPFLLASDNQTYIAPTNYPLQLYKNGDGTFTVQEAYQNPGVIKDKVEYTVKDNLPSSTFDSSGKLIRLTDGQGNTTSLTWNAAAVVITDPLPAERHVTINLDTSGRAAGIVDPDGVEKVAYSYDGSGNLTGATYKDTVYGDKTVGYTWRDGVIVQAVDKNGVPVYLNTSSTNQLVSIGPVNLLSAPSFEDADSVVATKPYLWDTYVGNDGGSVTRDNAFSRYGKYCLHIQSAFQSGTSGTSYLYAFQTVKVKPNQAYTLSAAIKTNNLQGRAFLNIRQLDSAMNPLNPEWTDNRPGLTGSNDWTDSRITAFTTAAAAAYLVIYAEVEHDPSHFGGDAYFDGIQLQEGTVALGSDHFYGHTDFRIYTESTIPTCLVTSPAGEAVQYQTNNWGNPVLVMNDANGVVPARTAMNWDTADNLRSLITPEHTKTGGDNKGYTYAYDIVGNRTAAHDPIDRDTTYDYYFNHLRQTTLPPANSQQTIVNVWDPVNLNGTTSMDKDFNSKAYRYDDYGNLGQESNILGVADNRVLNSNFEAGYNAVAAPQLNRSSSAYTLDGTLVVANEPRYAEGKFGQALTIERGTTNLLDTEGGGASTDWSKWTHWGASLYWATECQREEPGYGLVYAGVNANSTETYLYDYYPYTTVSGQPYTFSLYLKADQNWTGTTTGYLVNPDWTFYQGMNQTITLTGSWQRFSWTVTSGQNQANVGVGLKFANLPVGIKVYAARPQLEALPYATSYADTSRSGELLTLPTGLFTAAQGTIEAWVKPLRSPNSTDSNQIQMIADVAGSGNNGLLLAIDQYGKFYIQAGNGSGVLKAISTTTAQKDTWYLVTGRWTTNVIGIYINGVKETTTSGTIHITLGQTPAVGRQANSAIRYLDGLIDDLRISNIARTDAAILETYTLGKPSGLDSNTTYKLNFDRDLGPVYRPTNWVIPGTAGRVNQAEYDPTAPFGGSHVLHIDPGTASYAYQWTDYIPLTGSADDFIVSGYLKVRGAGSDGVRLHVYWYNENSVEIKQDRCFALTQPQDWQHHFLVLTPPQDARSARVMAIVYHGFEGWFDHVQFEKSFQIREYNALENTSFERDFLQWSPSDGNSSIAANSPEIYYTGGKSLKIQRASAAGTSYTESQTVLRVAAGQTYTLSGLIKTEFGTVLTTGGARLHVYYYDLAGTYVSDYATQRITKNASGWIKYVDILTPDRDGFYKLRLEMTDASGTVYFDNIRFSNGTQVTNYTYDDGKNYVVEVQNQLGKKTKYANDTYGRVTQVTTPSQEVTHYAYDGQENLRTVTDQAGTVATYDLDGSGRVTTATLQENGTTTVFQSDFQYDKYGNLLQETAKPDLNQPASNKTTSYLYDEAGRLTGKVNPGDSASNPSISLGYSFFGPDHLKILNGPKYTFAYNLEGQTTAEALFDNNDAPTGEFTYHYDAMGRLDLQVEKDGAATETGRIDAPTGTAGKGPMYDALDRLLGFDLTYQAQAAYPVTYGFTYLDNGLIKTAQGAGRSFKFVFTEDSLPAYQINPNSTQDALAYNDARQVVASQTNRFVQSTNGTEITTSISPQWSSQYVYDDDGRVTVITGQGAGSPSAAYTYNNPSEQINRLTRAQISYSASNFSFDYTFNYAYDARGNLQAMDILNGSIVQQQTFSYNDDNQITTSGFTYDNSGNLTAAVIKGTAYHYVYDKGNRLQYVLTGGFSLISRYTYNSQGLRLSKELADGTVYTYHYFNGQVLYETKSSDASTILHALYLRTPQGKLLAVSPNFNISSQAANTWYYYHYNAHGDVIAVTDGSGNIFREYLYDPYGNIISVRDGSGSAVNVQSDTAFDHAYTYAGYRYDRETGLYYLNARYYVAGIGRFLTKDVYKGSADILKSLNRYGYSYGDPVNLVDLAGYDVGAPGMDLGVYTEYKKRGWRPTGSYRTPMPMSLPTLKDLSQAVANHGEAVTSGSVDFGGFALDSAIEDITKSVGKKAINSYAGSVIGGFLTARDVSETLNNNKYTTRQKIEKVTIQVLGGTADVVGGIVIGDLAAASAPLTAGVSIYVGAGAIGVEGYIINRTQNFFYSKLGLQ